MAVNIKGIGCRGWLAPVWPSGSLCQRIRSEFAAAVIIQGVTADRPGEEKTFKCYELDVTRKLVEDEGEMDAPNPGVQPGRPSLRRFTLIP